jgi:hypothetical protein
MRLSTIGHAASSNTSSALYRAGELRSYRPFANRQSASDIQPGNPVKLSPLVDAQGSYHQSALFAREGSHPGSIRIHYRLELFERTLFAEPWRGMPNAPTQSALFDVEVRFPECVEAVYDPSYCP